jgi:hypothetical protein
MPGMLKKNTNSIKKNDVVCEFVLDMLRQVCGSGLEIAEV